MSPESERKRCVGKGSAFRGTVGRGCQGGERAADALTFWGAAGNFHKNSNQFGLGGKALTLVRGRRSRQWQPEMVGEHAAHQ